MTANLRLDFHATSKTDELDDDNLYGRVNVGTLSSRTFDETGADSNKPWTGERPTFYDLRSNSGPIPLSAFPSWLRSRAVMIPLSGTEPTPQPPEEPMFQLGDTIKTIGEVKVRQGPAKSTPQIGIRPAGAIGTLAKGPVVDTVAEPDIIYWKITEFGGWIGQDRFRQ